MNIPSLITPAAIPAPTTGSTNPNATAAKESNPLADLFATLLGAVTTTTTADANSETVNSETVAEMEGVPTATVQALTDADVSVDEISLDLGSDMPGSTFAMSQFAVMIPTNIIKSPPVADLDPAPQLAQDATVIAVPADEAAQPSLNPAIAPSNSFPATTNTSPALTTTEPHASESIDSPARDNGTARDITSAMTAPTANKEMANEQSTNQQSTSGEPVAITTSSKPTTPPRAERNDIPHRSETGTPNLNVDAAPIFGAAAIQSASPTPVIAKFRATTAGNDAAAVGDAAIAAPVANPQTTSLIAMQPTVTSSVEPTATSAPLAPATQQVLEAIEPMARRSDGTYHLKLSLNPHELGRVELSIELRDGVLAVHMNADRPETQRVLTEQLGKLREMLGERGVSMGSLDVGDHNSRNAFSAQAQSQDPDTSSRRSPRVTPSATDIRPTTVELPRIQRQSPSTNLLDVHA